MNDRWRWLAVLLLSVGCAHGASSGSGEPDASTFYPLAVGQTWTYRQQLLGEAHSMTVRILRQEAGYFIDSQGGELKVDASGVRDHQRYLLQNPVEEGHTWSNVLSPATAEHYRIESVGRACEAPAGKFQGCVEVEGSTRLVGTEGVLTNRMTFAPGVGLIRADVYLVRGTSRMLQSQLLLQSHPVRSGETPVKAP